MASRKSAFTRVCDFFFDRIRHRSAWDSASAAPATDFAGLRGHKYALLTSYRKTGEAVPSPVWFGVAGDGLVYFASEAAAPKVRRIANNPRVRLAPCDARAKPLGSPVVGWARILSPAEHSHAEQVIAASYGLERKLYELLFRRLQVYAYIEVIPVPADEARAGRDTAAGVPQTVPAPDQT